jgi:competence protein ComEC
MDWAVLSGDIDGVWHATVRVGIPRSRLAKNLRKGDCVRFTGVLVPYPGSPAAGRIFGGAFRPIDLDAVLGPWDPLAVVPSRADKRILDAAFSGIRSSLSERFGRIFSPDVSGTLSAMVLSDTSRLSPDLVRTYQTSGVYHLLSVSGEHMALLGAFVAGSVSILAGLLPYGLLRQAYVRVPVPTVLGILSLAVMGFYLILIGAPLPAQRAFLGLAVLTAARGIAPSWTWKDALGFSVLVLLVVDPEAPLSLSFDLSLSALLGLAVFLDRADNGEGNARAGPLRKGIGARALEVLLGGAYITLATAPLLWLCFRLFDWVGIVSNGIVVPLAGDVLLPAGFVYAGVLWAFPQGWSLPNAILETIGQSVLGLVTAFSRFPHGQIPMPHLPPAAFLALSGAVHLWLTRGGRSRPGAALAALAAVLVLSAAVHGLGERDVPSRALAIGGPGVGFLSYDGPSEAKNLEWFLGG